MAKKKDPIDPDAAAAIFRGLMPEDGLAHKGCDPRPFPKSGLPLRTLAERILFGANVMLFGRTYEFYGVERTCKSAFLFDRYRLAFQHGGVYLHCDAEDKDANDLRVAVLGHPPNHDDAKWTRRPDTMNDWMKSVWSYLDFFQKACEKGASGLKGRAHPMIIGVDSIVGKVLQEVYDKIEKNHGSTEARFALEAKALKDWMRWLTSRMDKWPIMFAYVTHDSPSTDTRGYTTHKSAGGMFRKFAATTRILFQSRGDLKMSADGTGGQTISLKAEKNSAGVTGSEVWVRFHWKTEQFDADQPSVLRAWWDWDAATAENLWDVLEDEDVTRSRKDAIKEATGLRRLAGNFWSCDAVGVTDDEPLSSTEVGQKINDDPVLSARLDEIFEVQQHHAFRTGECLFEQLDWKPLKVKKRRDEEGGEGEE